MISEKAKFCARLNEALDEARLPKIGHGRRSALAEMLGISAAQAGKWLKGEDFPQTSKLVKLAQCLGVRSNWLLSGVGEKYVTDNAEERLGAEKDEAVLELAGDASVQHVMLTNEAFDMEVAWMKLSPTEREVLRKVVVELASCA
jgi:transcriptional regulator with XRE-family HTH domain